MSSIDQEVREVAAAFFCGLADAATVVRTASELLATTADRPEALVALAVLPPEPDAIDLRELLADVFTDAGDAAALEGVVAQELALRFGCLRYLDGVLDPCVLLRWAKSPYPPEPARFTTIWWIEENYDDGLLTDDDLEQQLTDAARQYLTATQNLTE
jgi:hypothetical protein